MIAYYVKPPPGESSAMDAKRGKTDTNGQFYASQQSRSADLFFSAEKDGYYRSHVSYELGAPVRYTIR